LKEQSNERTLVFTLGFDVTTIIARLSELNLNGREHLIFIVPEISSPRAVVSRKSIESHIAVLNSRGFNLSSEFLVINNDAKGAIAQILETLNKHDKIFVELSGGLRYLVLATYIASNLLKDKVETVSARLETDGSRISIPLLGSIAVSRPDLRLLQELESLGRGSQLQIAKIMAKRISSVSRSLARLQRMGLIEVSASHPRIYVVSSLGRVFLKRLLV